MAKKSVKSLTGECEDEGLPVGHLLAELTDEQAAAFCTGVLCRLRRETVDEPEDRAEAEMVQRGYAYADMNGNGPSLLSPMAGPPEQEVVKDPPDGLRIDAAQKSGSTRGGEENTAHHPGSPTSDRQEEKTSARKGGKDDDKDGDKK